MDGNIGIVGLGRVGRSIFRTNFLHRRRDCFKLKVLCDVMPITQVAYLLQHDSTYGSPPYSIIIENDFLIINDCKIRYLQVDRRQTHKAEEYLAVLKSLEIDVLINATGTAVIDDLRQLIDKGICQKVLCSWNIAGADASLVYGVNHHHYNPANHHIVSASTCTGNAMAPVAMILQRHYGIDFARIVTIHPALSDQHILDGYHKHPHLGRTTAASVIPTATNVADSTARVIPELNGKLDSFSYRVPTEIVSLMDITVQLSNDCELEDIKQLFLHYATHDLKDILHCDMGSWGYNKVSIDFIGSPYSCIILMDQLHLTQQRHLGISLMHDNEQGYCCRALDILSVLLKNC
jgi:glyceraldehyde 3-phosphate dehydrogenase